MQAPRLRRFRVAATQELGIPFRIEHDHDIAAMNVLGDQDLGEPRLADARRTEHERVADPLTERQEHRLLGSPTACRWLGHRRARAVPMD